MYLWYPVIILKASLQISYRTIFLVAEITAKPANLPAKIRGLSRAAVWCTASQSEPQGQNGFHEKFSLWKDVVKVIVLKLIYYGLFYKFHMKVTSSYQHWLGGSSPWIEKLNKSLRPSARIAHEDTALEILQFILSMSRVVHGFVAHLAEFSACRVTCCCQLCWDPPPTYTACRVPVLLPGTKEKIFQCLKWGGSSFQEMCSASMHHHMIHISLEGS